MVKRKYDIYVEEHTIRSNILEKASISRSTLYIKKRSDMVTIKTKRITSVRMSFNGAINMERWKKLLVDASTRLTKIKWLASKMFNHFVINHIIDDPVNKFEIADDNALVRIIRLCFTVLTDAISKKIHRIVSG